MRISTLLMVLSLVIFSCSKQAQDNVSKEFMQSARGDYDEVIVVVDSAEWEGSVGSAVRRIFRRPMQGLPQDEPLFRINKASPLKLNSVLKSAVNMIFVMTLDNDSRESRSIRNYFTDESLKTIDKDTSKFMLVKRDEFAKGQTVLYLFSKESDLLADQLERNADRIRDYFEEQVRNKVASSLLKSRESQVEKAITENHGVSIKVPFGWELAKNTDNFLWVRLLDVDKEQNVFMYHEAYKSAEVFEDVIALRDRITSEYLRDSQKEALFITRPDCLQFLCRVLQLRESMQEPNHVDYLRVWLLQLQFFQLELIHENQALPSFLPWRTYYF